MGRSKEKLTAAEKQRRYRAKRDSDPDRRAIYLDKERLAWQKKKATGDVKSIHELSERAKRAKRKQWRDAQRQHRSKASCELTPPATPASSINGELNESFSRYLCRL